SEASALREDTAAGKQRDQLLARVQKLPVMGEGLVEGRAPRLSGLVPQAVQVVSERFALAEPRRAGLHASEERGRVRAAVLSRRLQIRQQALLPCRVEEDGLELRQGRGTVVPGRST